MIRAAGAIFLCKASKRILMNFRSESVAKPNCWGFWGGKLDPEENILTGLSREIIEELGFIPKYDNAIILDEYVSPDGQFKYYSFVVMVPEEFIPITNDESQGYCWCKLGSYPKPLHPGARAILENKVTIKTLFKLCG